MEGFSGGAAQRGDHDLSREWVVKREVERARSGRYAHVFVSSPAGTMGALGRSSRLSTRSEECPLGTGVRECEKRENVLGEAALRICEAVDHAGGEVVICQPAKSLLYGFPRFVRMRDSGRWDKVHVDMCAYGLTLLGEPSAAIKKEMVIWTNCERLKGLGKRCPGGHTHTHAQGRVRSGGGSRTRGGLTTGLPQAFLESYGALSGG